MVHIMLVQQEMYYQSLPVKRSLSGKFCMLIVCWKGDEKLWQKKPCHIYKTTDLVSTLSIGVSLVYADI